MDKEEADKIKKSVEEVADSYVDGVNFVTGFIHKS